MRANIYVSATFEDLVEHREAVREAIRALDHVDVSMEHYVAEPKRPLVRCLDDVRRCDLYLGIFGHRYGYVPPGSDRSITEQEYRAALKHGKDVICFLRQNDGSAADEPETSVTRLRALRDEISINYLAGFFSTPDELAAKASAAIVRTLRLDTTPVDEEREHRLMREWRQGATRIERARARQALVNMASPRYAAAIKDLLLQAEDDADQIAEWLGELLALSVTSRQVMPILVDLLHAQSAKKRGLAVFQIGEVALMGKEIPTDIVRQIVPLRDDPDPRVREQLAHTLGKIQHAEEMLPLVRACLEALAQDATEEVRIRAEESRRLTA